MKIRRDLRSAGRRPPSPQLNGDWLHRLRVEAKRSTGTATITVVVALTALIAAGSLAIDVGMVWTARTQLQNVADGAALAAALNMIDKDTPAVTIPTAEDAAVARFRNRARQSSVSARAPVEPCNGRYIARCTEDPLECTRVQEAAPRPARTSTGITAGGACSAS